jgi:hypothetical protein
MLILFAEQIEPLNTGEFPYYTSIMILQTNLNYELFIIPVGTVYIQDLRYPQNEILHTSPPYNKCSATNLTQNQGKKEQNRYRTPMLPDLEAYQMCFLKVESRSAAKEPHNS